MTPSAPPILLASIDGLLPLASAAGSGKQAQILLWVGVLIAVVIVASVVILALRRRFLADDRDAGSGGGFLAELRGMRDRGEISEEEFERTRNAIVAAVSGKKTPPVTRPKMERDAPPEQDRP